MCRYYYCLLLQTVALCILSTTLAAPVDNTESPEQSKSELKFLINSLKSQMEGKVTGKETQHIDNKENDPRSTPSKRNCRVNLSNDCGSSQTAHINGLKNFFGNKRRLSSSTSLSAASEGTMEREARTLPKSAKPYRGDSETKEESTDEILLAVLNDVHARLTEDRKRTDVMCIMLTGWPCDQQMDL